MKSVKPGRGPSLMGGAGAALAAAVGVIWTVSASAMGAPGVFTAFGVIFIVAALLSGAYNVYNALAKRRFSSFDVTEHGEEPDPLETRARAAYCVSCGERMDEGDRFCARCGAKRENG